MLIVPIRTEKRGSEATFKQTSQRKNVIVTTGQFVSVSSLFTKELFTSKVGFWIHEVKNVHKLN